MAGSQEFARVLLRDDRITKAAFKEMGVLSPNLVVPTLMNAKRNQEVLDNFPHKLYGDGDLAIVLRIIYHSTDCLLEDMHLNLRVTSEMLNEFGMDFDTLYQWSLDNPENQRAVSVEPFGTEPEKKDIYIMTTESFYWGASAFYTKKKYTSCQINWVAIWYYFLQVSINAWHYQIKTGTEENGFRQPSTTLNKMVFSRGKKIYPIIFMFIAGKQMRSVKQVKGCGRSQK